MEERLRQKINELKFYIQLEELNPLIEEIVVKIFSSGCKLMAYKNGNSKHQVTKLDCIIFLNVSDNRDRLHLLWDLIHEFGHHLDPDKLDKNDAHNPVDRIRREETAWILADSEFQKHPELFIFEENYLTYKRECLQSYKYYINLL